MAATCLRGAPAAGRERARARLWPLLHAALFASLRAQAGRIGPVSAEDLEDLASQKALELLVRAEEGTWDPGGRAGHEVAGYVARVARHALVDLARRRGRETAGPDDPEAWEEALVEHVAQPPGPEEQAAAREFAEALQACVERLTARARRAWFGRVYLERPSRELAGALGVRPSHVDVIVQRARLALRTCMEARGHRDADPRPGTFVALWRHLGDALNGDEREGAGDEPG